MPFLDSLLSRFGYVGAQAVQQAVEAGVESALLKAASQDVRPAWALAQAQAARQTTAELAGTATQQATLYTKLTWIATAIDHVAEHAAGYKYNVKELAGEEETDIPNHPFEQLLHNPNPRDSRFEFMRDLYSWYKLTGNALIWMNRASEFDMPSELWVLPSNLVKPVPDGKMYLRGYLFDTGQGQGIPLETWEVCHIKTANPLNPFWGLSAVQQLAVVSVGDLAQQLWNTNLFDKENAKIPGALGFASMIQNADWERLKEETAEKWGGTKRTGPLMLRGVGPGGVEWIPMGLNQKEMEFLASRKFTKEEIYGRLAPGLASVLDVNATEANAIAGKSVLLEFAVWPILQAVGDKLSKAILPAYGPSLVGEFDDPRQSNQLLDLKEQEEYGKVHTIDEIRKQYYGDKEIGDERGKLLPAEVTAKGLAQQVIADSSTPETGGDTQPAPAPIEAQPAAGAELKAWEKFALARLGKKNARDFEPHALPLLQAARIQAALKSARDADAVRRVFDAESGGASTLAAVGLELVEQIRLARAELAKG